MEGGGGMKFLTLYQGIGCICLGAVLVTGCGANEYDGKVVQKKDLIVSSVPTTIRKTNEIIFVTTIREPKSEQELLMVQEEIKKQSEDVVLAYYLHSPSSGYTTQLLDFALQERPALQFYLVQNTSDEEQSYLCYPNVTYVQIESELQDKIQENYTSNEICSMLIQDFRIALEHGMNKVNQFDFEQCIEDIKKVYQNVDQEKVVAGIDKFYQYVSHTSLFQKGEQLNDSVTDYVTPYMEKAIPVVLEQYEMIEPQVTEVYKNGKIKVKEWLAE